MQYYTLNHINTYLPNFWYYVKPYILERDSIKFQQLALLNDEIEMLDIKTPEDSKMFGKQNKELYVKLKAIYDKGKSSDRNNSYQSTNTAAYQQVDPQQQYYGYQNAGYSYGTNYPAYGGNYANYQTAQYDPNAMYYHQQPNYQGWEQQQQPQQGYQQQPQQGYQQQLQQGYQQQPQQGYQSQQYNQFSSSYNQGHSGQRQHNNYQNRSNFQQQQNQTQNYGQQGYQYQQTGYTNDQYQQQQQQTQQGYQNEYHGHHKNNQYSNNNHKYVAKDQYETQQEKVPQKMESSSTTESAVVPPPKKEEVKPEPVKLEKKKFSVQEIRKMIASVSSKDLKSSVDKNLLKEIQEVQNWPKKIDTVTVEKKQYPRDNKKGGKHEGNREQGDFNKGSKYQKNQTTVPSTAQPSFDIRLGSKQNLQTALFKNVLKKKAEGNFADQKAKQEDKLDKIDKAKREILFNLNRVAPQNVKDIFNEIEGYATSDHEICVTLVDSIIQKSWQQPKYAASYAKLSSYCAKIEINKFNFDNEKREKKNPFQRILIDKVQHSFDKRQMKDAPKSPEDLEKFARESKNLLVGNVKFIAELIKIRLIPKIIIKYCISQLISNFLQGYYDFFVNNNTQLNFYEYNFEALIEFLENLGEKYQSIEEKQKQKGQKEEKQQVKASNYKEVEQKLKQICKLQKPFSIIEGYDNLKANEYFASLTLISQFALPKVKDGRRIIALLQNLEQRRFNNWKKHNVESEGPKKLKDLKNQEQQMTPEQKAKAQQALLDDKMSKLLKKLVENDKKVAHQQLFSLTKKYKTEEIIGSYLKFVSDDRKEHIASRMEIFDIIMQKYGGSKVFKSAWKSNFSNIAFLVSQFPYCAAVLAKFLVQFKEKYGGEITDFFIKYNEDDEEDEYYFMDSVFQKAYHYSNDPKITEVITPAKKVTHLLE